MDRLSIIIPAHNEQDRIGNTLKHYTNFLTNKKELDYEIVVVLNGCTDNTRAVVEEVQKNTAHIRLIDLPKSGKGHALIQGFKDALTRNNTLIGFVDADMATSAQAFYELITHLNNADGIIASRYITGADIKPKRPFIKRWGSRLIYEPLVWLLYGLAFKDLQCGAKVFKKHVINTIINQLSVTGWAIDVELLYLCKKYSFTIKEIPTVWRDKKGSKLTMSNGLAMLTTLFKTRFKH
jgi:glycosyltransferase involved in cell wall biosynthesis